MKKRTVQNGFLFIITIVLPAILLTCCKPQDKGYTRGIGVYPGNPDEDFSPDLCVDNTTYRNLALLTRKIQRIFRVKVGFTTGPSIEISF